MRAIFINTVTGWHKYQKGKFVGSVFAVWVYGYNLDPDWDRWFFFRGRNIITSSSEPS